MDIIVAKELTSIANDLDSKGLTKEADNIDRMIKTAWGLSLIHI